MCPAGLFSFYRHPTEPVSFGCQVPSSKFVCISPSVPYHCHQYMGMTSRPREPSEHQQDSIALRLQENPSS